MARTRTKPRIIPKAEIRQRQLNRIIVGNQIATMRALATLTPSLIASRDLNIRVTDIKNWWRDEHGEEVGFSPEWGDQPPR